jgi:hypothetical protein
MRSGGAKHIPHLITTNLKQNRNPSSPEIVRGEFARQTQGDQHHNLREIHR